MRKAFLAVAVVGLFAVVAVSQTVYSYSKTTYTYCGTEQLDIYYPATLSNLDTVSPKTYTLVYPVVMWVHGGGWHQGSRNSVPSWLLAWTEANGVALVSIDYRLAPQYLFPAQIEDAQCAVRFLKSHAVQLQLNGSRIDAIGASAGAHLVLLLGMPGTPASWESGDNQWEGSSSAVRAVVSISAPTNLTDTASLSENALLNISLAFPPSQLVPGSPVTYAPQDTRTPVELLHGYNDTLVYYPQAIEMHNALANGGRLVLVNCAGHGLAIAQGCTTSNPTPSQWQTSIFNAFENTL